MSDAPRPIDARGPRFAAMITAFLLAISVILGITGLSAARTGVAAFGWFAYQPLAGSVFVPDGAWAVTTASLGARALDPGWIFLTVIAALFAWGLFSPGSAPGGVLFRRLVAPRLSPATAFEDPRPPRFAQGVGLFVTALGVVLHLAGVPLAVPIAAGAAFLAAFLNAAFGVCLGCMLYLGLQRLRARAR